MKYKNLIQFALFVHLVANAFSNVAYAKKYSGCNPGERATLETTEQLAIVSAQRLVKEIETAISDSERPHRKKENDHKLRHAARILNCSIRKLNSLNYKCEEANGTYYGRTIWVFGRQMSLTSDLFIRSDQFVAGVLIHEATHKCTTTDAAYFFDESPHGTAFVGWPMIADTYRYWINSGFCIPGETCP